MWSPLEDWKPFPTACLCSVAAGVAGRRVVPSLVGPGSPGGLHPGAQGMGCFSGYLFPSEVHSEMFL